MTLPKVLAALLCTGLAFAQSKPAKRANPKQAEIVTTLSKEPYVVGDREILLVPSAARAIEINKTWQESEAMPLAGADGRVVYTYGKGLPNIPCEPYNLTTIELQPGEKFDGEVPYEIADGSVWTIDKHWLTGEDGQIHSYLVLRPTRLGSKTGLTVFTDRRKYDFLLLSSSQGHVTRVAFRYPEWEAAQALKAVEAAKLAQVAADAQKKRDAEEARRLKASDSFGSVNSTDYDVHVGRGADYMRPVSVFDDGAHTVISLPESARHRDLPVVKVVGRTGADTPNIHLDVENLRYVVDGLFERADLVTGVGSKQIRIQIVRGNHGH